MKIIKRGKLPEQKIIRFTCIVCKSELEAFDVEGKKVYSALTNYYYLKYICPICKNEHWHKCEKP
jgi:uncharacterized protein with PIN domain